MTAFIVPQEPRLSWRMFWPSWRWREHPLPLPDRRTSHVFWARNALYHSLTILGIRPGDAVLVPAYHCAMAIEPFVRYGATVQFYNIHEDCSLDLDDIQRKITPKTRALLMIHYFGYPQPMRALQALCHTHHLALIEDCAHVLRGDTEGQPLGTFGDVSVFSWRKFFPLYDGGYLVVNNPEFPATLSFQHAGFVLSAKIVKNMLDKVFEDSPSRLLHGVSALLHLPYVAARYLVQIYEHTTEDLSVNNYSLDFEEASLHLSMSKFSRYVLRHLDLEPVIAQRRANALYLLQAIATIPGLTPFFPTLPTGVCPLAFPILAAGHADIHVGLRARGIPAFTWGGVIHPLLALEEYPEAAFLYHHMVMLPIHQDIDETDLHTILTIVAEEITRHAPPHAG